MRLLDRVRHDGVLSRHYVSVSVEVSSQTPLADNGMKVVGRSDVPILFDVYPDIMPRLVVLLLRPG